MFEQKLSVYESFKNGRPPPKAEWIARKYFMTINNDNWVFAAREEGKPFKLITHSSTKIKRYVKVKGNASLTMETGSVLELQENETPRSIRFGSFGYLNGNSGNAPFAEKYF